MPSKLSADTRAPFIRCIHRTTLKGERVARSRRFSRAGRQHDSSVSGRRGPRQDRKWIDSPVSAPALTDENRPRHVQREKVI